MFESGHAASLLALAITFSGATPEASAQVRGERPGLDRVVGSYQRLAQKFRDGETIEVAFVGGSNTIGKTSEPEVGVDPEHGPYDIRWYDAAQHSFRALIVRGLQDRFGVVPGQVVEINAAYGGAPVALAAWRLEQDVLAAHPEPDLLVIDYVVNDMPLIDYAAEEDRSIARSVVSLLDQVETSYPDAAVLSLLMTLRGGITEPEQDLQIEAAVSHSEHLRVLANHMAERPSRRRDVAILDAEQLFHLSPVPPEVGPLFLSDNGSLVNKHPSPYGHAYVAGTAVDIIESRMTGSRSPIPAHVPYAAPLLPFPRNPRLITAQELFDNSHSSGFYVAPAEDHTPIFVGRDAFYATGPGDTIEFAFESRGAFDLWVQKRYADDVTLNARIEIRVDDGPWLLYTAPRQPNADGVLSRYTPVASDLPYEVHTIQINVLEGVNELPFALAFHAFLRDDD
jgi:hypothetical protein